ncbi:DUF2852 domain-containing protein [Rhizobium sp. KVB221]|uniref:DUF2852 domain-containing protein n=1 Tax=Rhizobium setariae TaxID=2801340 RepID=A0A937CQ96_9HYPH|nr:DUF2852 domain-containing protein [Rhizobium setariae]MBL0374169.1 DUF2852 domain-containing protein [Rhizobium setariae]
MYRTALIRPDWTPATIALMVLGFVVFWPLGLAMLAYILFGERLQAFKRDANEKVDGFARSCRGGRWRNQGFHHQSTGNSAFDDWRRAELDRIEEERRKLDEMRADFDSYMRELRRARDKEEFDRFMRERNARKTDLDPQNGFSG